MRGILYFMKKTSSILNFSLVDTSRSRRVFLAHRPSYKWLSWIYPKSLSRTVHRRNELIYSGSQVLILSPEILSSFFENYFYIFSFCMNLRLAAFQRYILFCQLLFPYYDDLLQHKMVVFITRTILCNVLNFISSKNSYTSLFLAALKFLQTFIQQWVSDDSRHEKSTAVFKRHLSNIMDKLVPLASRKDNLGEHLTRISFWTQRRNNIF